MPGMLENTYNGKPVSVHHTVADVKNALKAEYSDIKHMAMEEAAIWKQPVMHKERAQIFSKGPANSAYKALRYKQRSTGTEINY